MKIFTASFLVLGALALSRPAGATILLTESFDAEAYPLWNTCDGRHEHVAGWSGQAARLFPPHAGGPIDNCPAEAQGYAGVGSFTWPGHEPTRLNIRVLMRFGPTFAERSTVEGSKLLIVQRGYDNGLPEDDDSLRFMSFLHHSVRGLELEVGQNIQNYGADDAIFFDLADRQDQWLSVEMEADLPNMRLGMYVTTEDGAMQETHYIDQQASDSGCPYSPCWTDAGSFFRSIQILGGYWGGMSDDDPDSYVIFDEMVVSDEYIGPPPGFGSGSSTGAGGSGGTGGETVGSGAGGTSTSTGGGSDGDLANEDGPGSSGGCSLGAAPEPGATPRLWPVLAALALLGALRRRRTPRAPGASSLGVVLS